MAYLVDVFFCVAVADKTRCGEPIGGYAPHLPNTKGQHSTEFRVENGTRQTSTSDINAW